LEFENVVCTLEAEGEARNLDGAIIFFPCTSNSTVEAALAKGNSSSQKLRMRKLEEMNYLACFVISHVSGERIMKAQGTDGVSRGQMKEGVSAGLSMMSFMPFHQIVLDCSPSIREWIISWLGKGAKFLEPKDWFEQGHDALGGMNDAKGFWRLNYKAGQMVWMPPPGAANVVLEEL
jgi:hypothetical protein